MLRSGSLLKSIRMCGCTDTVACPNVTGVWVQVSGPECTLCVFRAAHLHPHACHIETSGCVCAAVSPIKFGLPKKAHSCYMGIIAYMNEAYTQIFKFEVDIENIKI